MPTAYDLFTGTSEPKAITAGVGLGTWNTWLNSGSGIIESEPTVSGGKAHFASVDEYMYESAVCGNLLAHALGAWEMYADVTVILPGVQDEFHPKVLLSANMGSAGVTVPPSGVLPTGIHMTLTPFPFMGSTSWAGVLRLGNDVIGNFDGPTGWTQGTPLRIGMERSVLGVIRPFSEPAGGGARTYYAFTSGNGNTGTVTLSYFGMSNWTWSTDLNVASGLDFDNFTVVTTIPDAVVTIVGSAAVVQRSQHYAATCPTGIDTCAWTQVSGIPVVIADPDNESTDVHFPTLTNGGVATIRATVTDDDGGVGYKDIVLTMTCIPFSDISVVTPTYTCSEPVAACNIS